MSSVSAFLDMGGYAAFVWPSYGITLLIVALNIYLAQRRLAQAREEARRRIAMRGEENT
jgi:heme exporter protein D